MYVMRSRVHFIHELSLSTQKEDDKVLILTISAKIEIVRLNKQLSVIVKLPDIWEYIYSTYVNGNILYKKYYSRLTLHNQSLTKIISRHIYLSRDLSVPMVTSMNDKFSFFLC